MADENEETTPKTDSRENAAAENEMQADENVGEPAEEPAEQPAEQPEEQPAEELPIEPAGDENREERIEEPAEEPDNAQSAPDDIVETTEEIPEMEDRKAIQSRDRSVAKSDSGMGVPKRSQDSEPAMATRDLSSSRNKDVFNSRAKMVVGDVIDIRRSSMGGDNYDRKPAKFMNSYVMSSENPFNPEVVIKILKAVMEEAMAHLSYDPQTCIKQAKWASSALRAKIKTLNYDRYKIVSVVTIGEKHSQDVYSTCRFLWDAEKDRYTSYAVENTNVYGIGLCFGMYYE